MLFLYRACFIFRKVKPTDMSTEFFVRILAHFVKSSQVLFLSQFLARWFMGKGFVLNDLFVRR